MNRRAVISAILLAGIPTGCSRKEPEGMRTAHLSGETMGTYYSITCRLPPGVGSEKIHDGILSLFAAVDGELSNWNPESWVSRFNRAGKDEEINCPPHALQVLELSMELARRTDGALDPTVSPLVELWGFGESPEPQEPPHESEIRGELARCGHGKLDFNSGKRAVSKRVEGMELNLSAVAKGHAVDLVADFLGQEGIRNHLVNIGGEVRATGMREDGGGWLIGVEGLAGRMRMSRGAVATSGNSQRFITRNGRRYTHIIDPRSGMPVDGKLRSVSVTAPTCALADGLATACFVLGPEEGLKLVDSHAEAEALFLLADGTDVRTAGWGR
ncbi:FAD:protein FMN transferase [Akkermansiaceae bacterium]|nr:FAD:protein FMN transferase [Akkermansiaceae bacterium]